MARETIDFVCDCYRKATKVISAAAVSGTVYWSYLILPFGIVAFTCFPTTFLEIAVSHSLSAIQIIECTFILNATGKETETQHVHLIPVLL